MDRSDIHMHLHQVARLNRTDAQQARDMVEHHARTKDQTAAALARARAALRKPFFSRIFGA